MLIYGSRIDRVPINDHPKIEVWTIGETTAPNGCDAFAAVNHFRTLRQLGATSPR